MNSGYREVKDLQRIKYDELLKERLPKVVRDASRVIDDKFNIECKMFPVDTTNVISENGTEFYPIRMNCSIKNNLSNEQVSFNIDVINLPVLYELGFKVGGNYMQMLDSYERATGWSFLANKKNPNKPLITASVLAQYGKTFSFVYNEMRVPFVQFSRRGKKYKISVSVFFRALTGMSNTELLSKFGASNPFVVETFTNRFNDKNDMMKKAASAKSANDCIEMLAKVLLGEERANSLSTIQLKKREIEQSLFSANYFNLKDGNYRRFSQFQSYANRAGGRELAERVVVGEHVYEPGTVVTEEIGELLDALPIHNLKIKHDGKIYELKKFSSFSFECLGMVLADSVEGIEAGTTLGIEEIRKLNNSKLECIKIKRPSGVVEISRRVSANSLTLEDLFTAFSIWMNNLNGYELYDDQYDLGNRTAVAFDDKVYECVSNRVDNAIEEITGLLNRYDVGESLLLTISELKLNDKKNEFIDELKNSDSKDSQMSDMCNVISYISKSNKLTTDIKSTRATNDMRNVQTMQEGRIDPFDSPESAKIGLVHHKTLLADTNENGDLVEPYLEVKDGEVIGEDPVYLSAIEESGKYIAMWNETFKEDDGTPKKRVTVRYNGEHVSVDVSKVSYKEYSPLQNVSANHSMITLANHSNGKRIIMSCNEQNQALVTVNNAERPLLGTGCESIIDFGNYCAKDVLQMYYENGVQMYEEFKQYKDKIMKSQLKLKSIHRIESSRVLTFEVLAMKDVEGIDGYCEASLEIPYVLKNFNDAEFSYKVAHTEDGVYEPEDVVACYQGYSLEKKERVDLVDYGGLKVKDNVFDKGLAMGRNLLVGYKTFGASTIEDALTINSNLIFDDTLTHVRLVMIKSTLHNSKTKMETFGCPKVYENDVFASNGLPHHGVKLKPGDYCIAKIVTKVGKQSEVRFDRVKANVEGQVIATEIVEKNGKTEAHVLVASRAPIENGDKMAGRHGNKGTIARIVPAEEMPYDPVSGRSLDICLNPLGVPSRQNVSQLLEVAISMCRLIDGKATNISPYHPNDLEFIKKQCEEFNVHPIRLIDGRTGEYFKRPINVGVLYMFKLHHVAANKLHAIGFDAPVDPTFLQPKKGSKNEGGQSFGEMENWCLHGVGANAILNDFYGLQSDDLASRENFNSKLLNRPVIDVGEEYNNNSNDTTLIAMLRSMGSELVSDAMYGSYELKPLVDSRIKAFSTESIQTAEGLHNSLIFGNEDSARKRPRNKSKWSWIDLNTKFIHPTWIYKNIFTKYVSCKVYGKSSGSFSKDVAVSIINGETYVDTIKSASNEWILYPLSDLKKDLDMQLSYEEVKEHLVTGLDAVVMIIEAIDLEACLSNAKNILSALDEKGERRDSKKYLKALEVLSDVRAFVESGNRATDYITTSFPIMPQNFRAKIEVGGKNNSIPDFDYYYTQIINAAKKIKEFPNTANKAALFRAVSDFVGYTEGSTKYKNVLMYFGGKGKEDGNDKHGKLRSAVQSKRLFCSGRAVISPARYEIKPTELGVPAIMLVKMAQSQLIAYFTSKASYLEAPSIAAWSRLFLQLAVGNFKRFNKVYTKPKYGFRDMYEMSSEKAFHSMRKWIVEYFENTKNEDGSTRFDRPVVLNGRQPSLHKYSIRAFYPVVLWSKAIELSPLLCAGFNADFDGDQMWVTLTESDEAREEAMQKMSPAVDFINPKNGSIMLKHTQDISLGCYVGTMLKDNVEQYPYEAKDIHYYSSLCMLEEDVFGGRLEPYDLVCFNPAIDHESNCYLSTAGRILFSSIFDDGLTDEPFTNVLGVKGIDPSRYRELKYDALITSGKPGKGVLKYLNLQDICMDRYLSEGDSCINCYYDIEVYGFRFSDLYSVTLSIEDLDIESNREQILAEMEQKKLLIEQDFQDGLIAPDDKKDAVIKLFKDDKIGAGKAIEEDLIQHLPRNNNLFIMMDSGARGNKSQIMQMCGSIGILSKNNSESMENPVINNYYNGLTDFDVHSTSYSARTGMASTQMESRNAGYATRRVVYMTDGTAITASDCGKQDWWYDVKWGDLRRDLIRFYPSNQWIEDHAVGKVLSSIDGDECNFSGHDVKAYQCLQDKGFNNIVIDSERVEAEPEILRHSILIEGDENAALLFNRLLSNGRFGSACLTAFNHYKLLELQTSFGKLVCRYKMDSCCKSELYLREARNLPFLKEVCDEETGDSMCVITEETLNAIEEQGLNRVEARIMLDCECKHGICAHCYGLKYSNFKIPKVGEVVGTESAQSIGEPAAQLTMDVVNKGGASNAALTSGLDVFSAYLGGSVIGGANARTADIPDVSGYARVSKMGDLVSIAVEPLDKECAKCKECQAKNVSAGGHGCPLALENRKSDPLCAVPERTPSSMLLVQNGEWVKSGSPITDYPVISNSVVSVEDSTDPRVVLRRKQMIWVYNYYNIFHSQSIDIQARHFELLALIQNQNAIITKSSNPDFKLGEVYKLSELRNAGAMTDGTVEFSCKTSSLEETILSNSGLLTALTFANQSETVSKLTANNYKSSSRWNTSPIGKISVGQKLDSTEVKPLNNREVPLVQKAQEVTEFKPDVVEIETPLTKGLDVDTMSSLMDGFDLDVDNLFGTTESAADDENRSVHYTVSYYYDSVKAETFDAEFSGTVGQSVVPSEMAMLDGYELVSSDDVILTTDGQQIEFYFESIVATEPVVEQENTDEFRNDFDEDSTELESTVDESTESTFDGTATMSGF